MKKVNKNFLSRPINLNVGRATYDNAIVQLGLLKNWPVKYSSIYKSTLVKAELENIYKGKCAFCNQIPKGSPLQVEHFRPKNGIKNEIHSGYYWLGYEWTNLLFACGNCNSTKNTHFPLQPGVVRIISPTWINANQFDLNDCLAICRVLKLEKYILLNPEIDNPDEHLYYEADGKLGFLSVRGEVSIEKYNLNRDELYLLGRKKVLDDLIKKLAKRFLRLSKKEITLNTLYSQIIDIIVEDILEPIESNESFDHFRYILFKNYDLYILPRFAKRESQYLLNVIFSKLNYELIVKLN